MRALSTRGAEPVLGRGGARRGRRPAQATAWRRFRRSRLGRWVYWPALGVLAFAAVGTGAWTWESGAAGTLAGRTAAALAEASVEIGLGVRQVTVAGRRSVPREQVFRILGARRGEPILLFDVAAARDRLESLGWIESAVVMRRLPGTLHVRLVERRPFVLWQDQGTVVLIDPRGVAIEGAVIQDYGHLPLVVGADAPARAGALLEVLASEPALRARVAAAIRVGGRRWDVRFDNGVTARLPALGAAEAWRRIAELERQEGILALDIVSLDLRVPGRLIVRLAAGAAAQRRDPGESA